MSSTDCAYACAIRPPIAAWMVFKCNSLTVPKSELATLVVFVLRCAALRCAALRYVVLHRITLYYNVLRYIVFVMYCIFIFQNVYT